MMEYDYRDDYELFVEVAGTIDAYRKKVLSIKVCVFYLEEINVYQFCFFPIQKSTFL